MNRILRSLGQPGQILIRYWGMNLLNILGLAIGFAAAFIVALVVRSELGYDRFIGDVEHVYLLRTLYTPVSSDVISSDQSPAGMSRLLANETASVQATARLVNAKWPLKAPRFTAQQEFYWADSNFFDVVQLRAIDGDLHQALQDPASMVLTQKMARTFFGTDDVIGKKIVLSEWLVVTVTAVLADFPNNSSLKNQIFISSQNPYSMTSILDAHKEWTWTSCLTFVRMKPEATLTSTQLTQIAARNGILSQGQPMKFEVVPMTKLHFLPRADSPISARGHPDTIIAITAVAVLIVVLAAANFSELMAVQIDERRHEMAIRKTLGAQSHHIFLQILIEASILICLALILAVVGIEHILPVLDPIMKIGLSPWSEATFLIISLIVGFGIALIGALYPAIALSASHPRLSRNMAAINNRATLSRTLWTTTRFALLIILLITSHTVYQQWQFATSNKLNHDANHIYIINTTSDTSKDVELQQSLLELDGVTKVSSARMLPIQQDIWPDWIRAYDGRIIQAQQQSVDPNFFDFYNLEPLAGQTFKTTDPGQLPAREVVINRTALQALGYKTAQDAIGQDIHLVRGNADFIAKIIGVVGDIRLANIREPEQPMIFDNQPAYFSRMSIKLKPGTEIATLNEIRKVWALTYPNSGPMEGQFYADYIHTEYADMFQQWYVFGLLSIVGIAVSIFGLIGLSIHIFRTGRKDVAIRNALGARKADLIRLRLTPYVRPLLIANIIALPLSCFVANLWLQTFALHVDISLMTLMLSSASTFVITIGTLAIHTLLSESARSSGPLRNIE